MEKEGPGAYKGLLFWMIVVKVFREFQSVAVSVLDDVGHAISRELLAAPPVRCILSRHVLAEGVAVELHRHDSFGAHYELET